MPALVVLAQNPELPAAFNFCGIIPKFNHACSDGTELLSLPETVRAHECWKRDTAYS